MGIYTTPGTSIVNFTPDDTDTIMYIPRWESLDILIEKIHKKWGNDVNFADIEISAENIHTNCITYDLHDPSDYTNYIVVKRMNVKQ